MDRQEVYLGFDLGGTKMLAALVEADGRVVAREQQPTEPERGPDDVIRRLAELGESLLARSYAEGDAPRPSGVGVAAAGVLDPVSGDVVFAANLGWKNVALGRRLAERLGCPARVLNDANAAALGEWRAGAGRGTRDMLYVTVSTGIGAGIISGGRLLEGASHSAGELGHISIDRHGPACPCGNRGCVELYASGTAIAARARAALLAGDPRAEAIRRQAAAELGAGADAAGQATAAHVAAAAHQGDAYAAELLAEAGEALGMALLTAVHLLNPEAVVIGGGASRIGEPLLGPMRETIRRRGIPGIADRARYVTAELGGDAGAVGAALWRP